MFLNSLFNKKYPRLDWIQVEVSSFCNAECIYCPHTEYRNNWQNRLFPIELYKRLIPAFAKTKLVYLLAAQTYRRAANMNEPAPNAQERYSALQSSIPTQEDYFFHGYKSGDVIQITGDCFTWIGKSVTVP